MPGTEVTGEGGRGRSRGGRVPSESRREESGKAASFSMDPSLSLGGDSQQAQHLSSVAKLISKRFGGGLSSGKRLSGTALFASKSIPQSDALVVKRGGTGRRGPSFVSNLETLWRQQGGSPVALGWHEGWGWDEIPRHAKASS